MEKRHSGRSFDRRRLISVLNWKRFHVDEAMFHHLRSCFSLFGHSFIVVVTNGSNRRLIPMWRSFDHLGLVSVIGRRRFNVDETTRHHIHMHFSLFRSLCRRRSDRRIESSSYFTHLLRILLHTARTMVLSHPHTTLSQVSCEEISPSSSTCDGHEDWIAYPFRSFSFMNLHNRAITMEFNVMICVRLCHAR